MSYDLDDMSHGEGGGMSLTEMLMAEFMGSHEPGRPRVVSPPRQRPPSPPIHTWENVDLLLESGQQEFKTDEPCSMMEIFDELELGKNHRQTFESKPNPSRGNNPQDWTSSLVDVKHTTHNFAPAASKGVPRSAPPNTPPMNIPPPNHKIVAPPSSMNLGVPPPNFRMPPPSPMVPPPMAHPPIAPPLVPMAPPPPIIGPMSGPPYVPVGFHYPPFQVFNQHQYRQTPAKISVASIPDTTLAVQLKGIKKLKTKKNLKENVQSFGSQSTVPSEYAPGFDASDTLKHIKEHKLVIKNENKNVLKESSPNPTNKNEERFIQPKQPSVDPITSVRLAESDALPELYSKLKKLNAELCNLKEDKASGSSSNSDSDNESPFKKPRKKSENDERKSPLQRSDPNHMKPIEKSSFKTEAPSICKTNLDLRIKAMLSVETPKGKTTGAHTGTSASSNPNNTREASNTSDKSKSNKPLLRPPSPYLSRDIYYYWHKETVKFSKTVTKDSLPFVDPTVHYRFRDNRVVGSEQYDKKTQETCSKKKAGKEDNKQEDVTEELEEDYKRLEEINRQLQLLEQEEGEGPAAAVPIEVEHLGEDDEEGGGDDADLRRLAEIKKQLEQLEHNDNMVDALPIPEKIELEKNHPRIEASDKVENGGKKRQLDQDLIDMVMASVMSELKQDLKRSITDSLVDSSFDECHPQFKKQKVSV